MRTPVKPSGADRDQQRKRELAAIHAMKKELALADDCYRARVLQASNGRTDSSAELTTAERRALLDGFRALGAGQPKGKAAGRPTSRYADTPQLGKIRALWIDLHQAGTVKSRGVPAMDAFIAKVTGQQMGRLPIAQAAKVIEALKAMHARAQKAEAKG
ncbi:MAG TPA: regulatory protein GemA [Azospirillum sp.]|nr:regulatory protein GemA [Azospirillum sp.]